jgi:zinc protease
MTTRHLIRYLLAVATLWLSLPLQASPGQSAATATRARGQITAAALPLPPGVERVTSVEGITEYRLPNGLRVLLFPDESKQTITVNITYLVGSRHENYGESGMAHLLEHMLFKGSSKHINVPQELTEHGARSNADTEFDRTNYFETFTATDENLRWALDLEADRMVNSFVAKKDFDTEFSVVRNEFEIGENDPSEVLSKHVEAAAFDWHNYGKDVIGNRADIENVPIDRLQAFYRMYYQPDNAVLTVAGRIDETKTLALVSAAFAPVPKPSRALPTSYTVEPTQDGERSVTVRRVGDVQIVAAAYHVPAGADPDFQAVEVLTMILGDGSTGRLHKALVEAKKAVLVAASATPGYDPNLAMFIAQLPRDGSIDDVRTTLLQVIEEAARTPPTTAEVDRARTKLLRDFDSELASSERIGLDLSNYIAQGDWRLFFLRRDRIKQVTRQDVQRVAAAYLKPSNRTVGLFIPTPTPDRSVIPARPDVLAMVKDYKGGAAVATGEMFDPSPANIEARATRPTTAGGLKLVLVPKRTRGETVFAELVLHFGNEKDLMNQFTAGSFAEEMLMRGTTTRTREQLQSAIDQLNAKIRVSGSFDRASVSIETTHENLPGALRLAAEILRHPLFPESEFDLLKHEQIQSLELSRSEPGAIAWRTLYRHLSPYPRGDPRHMGTIEEELADDQAVTLDQAKQFYTDFYGASSGELSIVGDFDDKTLAPLAGDLFKGWKSKRPCARLIQTYMNVAPVNQAILTPDKANASFLAAMNLNLGQADPDYPALVLGEYMLGGGFLSSRLATRIRQKEGLSYVINSDLYVDSIDREGRFFIFADSAPENEARLETGVREELERALKDGFTADEVKAAKVGWLQSRQVARAADSRVADRLVQLRHENRTLAFDAELESKVEALTPDQILAAMRRQLDPAKLTIIKAGDFGKK